ncbi:hypothetical protein [Haematomicrobium sanguinis]|uniref:hypothetical protein n=1 Tax=Haematomicrobium sanguinis TaxID=479106 RepID=UPI00068E21E4|nr:hypothetical protein [Haematomicrobium sanguinis]
MTKPPRPPFSQRLIINRRDNRPVPAATKNRLLGLTRATVVVGLLLGSIFIEPLRSPLIVAMFVAIFYRTGSSGKRSATAMPGSRASGAAQPNGRGTAATISTENPGSASSSTRTGSTIIGGGAGNGSGIETPDQIRARARQKHDDILKKWRRYELDLAYMIDYPAMADPRVKETSDMINAMQDAEELRDSTDVGDYRDAVAAFELAFQQAELNAKSVKRNNYTPAELKSLERAAAMLAIAQDSSSTPSERRLAYQRLNREVEGLVVLPQEANAKLEDDIRLALEEG